MHLLYKRNILYHIHIFTLFICLENNLIYKLYLPIYAYSLQKFHKYNAQCEISKIIIHNMFSSSQVPTL